MGLKFAQKKYMSLYNGKSGLAYSYFSLNQKGAIFHQSEMLGCPQEMLFADKVKELGKMSHTKVVYTASPGDYQLFQVKKPLVDPHEMDNALLWAVQDRIFFPEDDFILSSFPCEKASAAEEVFVVALRKTTLMERLEVLKKHFKGVVSLKIPELNAIQLCSNTADANTFVVLMDNLLGTDMIYVIKNNTLLRCIPAPTSFDQDVSTDRCANLVESFKMIMAQLGMQSSFEFYVSPWVPQATQWISQIEGLMPKKVTLSSCSSLEGLGKTLTHEQLLTIGGGLSHAQDIA